MQALRSILFTSAVVFGIATESLQAATISVSCGALDQELALYQPIPELYQDEEVLTANPFFGELYDTFVSAVPRPSTQTGAKYNQVSNEFCNAVFAVLAGKEQAAASLESLEKSLNRMSRGGKRW